jgi:hypothetical protein
MPVVYNLPTANSDALKHGGLGAWITNNDVNEDFSVYLNDKKVVIAYSLRDKEIVTPHNQALVFNYENGKVEVEYVDKNGVHIKEIGPKTVSKLLAQLLNDAVDAVS